ncbi:hypothetical protein HYT26_05060 [Candidatus Pacearchaeota archaeon]|nr:hypothetical protein [Candidatus Pacearchaeota archaeon]
MKKCNREKAGNYEIKRHPMGGFSVFGNGIRDRGFYVPSDSRIKERYEEEGETLGLKTVLQYRAIPYCGKRSLLGGREALGLSQPKTKHPIVTKEEIVSAIRNFWKPDDVGRLMAGEDVELPGITDFRAKNERAYHAAQRAKIFRKQDGFESIVDEVYPGFYNKVNRKTQAINVNREHIGEILTLRFYSGLPLSKTSFLATKDRREKKILRQIQSLGSSHTKIVMNLTNLRKEDITGSRIKNDNAALAEELTEMFFKWAFFAGLELDFIKKGEVYTNGKEVKFLYNEKTSRADLRIGNQAVEVKTGLGYFCKERTLDIIEKYGKGEKPWHTGELLGRRLAIFHQRKELYEHALDEIEKAGIKTMGYDEFHSCLTELVGLMKKNFQDKISSIKPRVHNLDYIVGLHEEISLKPCVLMRRGNDARREWSHYLLKSLSEIAREIQTKEKNK